MQTNPVPDLLIDVLREAFALYAMTHLFHWNVRGPNFPQLHKLMNDQYDAIWEELDTLAERARGVGTLIPADVFVAPKAPARVDAKAMVQKLLQGNVALSKSMLKALDAANKANDQGTVNMLGGMIEYHDKNAWMLRSTLYDG